MQIGHPGQGGHDSVPLNVGGMPVMVAPGEQVACSIVISFRS